MTKKSVIRKFRIVQKEGEQRVVYMKNWVKKLDDFLILNDKKILKGSGSISHLEMEKQVREQLKKYNDQKLLKTI